MRTQNSAEHIQEAGVFAILRVDFPERVLEAVQALLAGDVKVVEVSMTMPGALDSIRQISANFSQDLLLGAGTILSTSMAEDAIQAGARFLVAPNLNLDLMTFCAKQDVLLIPGCFTPTEFLTAQQAGAKLIKLFPAEIGGPGLVKALLAPLPSLKIIPVGGITPLNTAAYLQAGASAVGLGSSLVNNRVLSEGRYEWISQQAGIAVEAVRLARSGKR